MPTRIRIIRKDDMPSRFRKDVEQFVWIVCIVDDEQPVLLFKQPLLYRLDNRRIQGSVGRDRLNVRLGKAQQTLIQAHFRQSADETGVFKTIPQSPVAFHQERSLTHAMAAMDQDARTIVRDRPAERDQQVISPDDFAVHLVISTQTTRAELAGTYGCDETLGRARSRANVSHAKHSISA